MNKLLVLDGNSVLHRAFYAMPDWRNRSGEATSGVYGFLSMLLKAMAELKPNHLAIVFDHPSPTFRNAMYVGYQTNREKDRQISEDIWGQVEKLKEIFQLIGVPVFQVSGFEADDVIGTLAVQASALGSEVIIITGDRDLMQLVNDQVLLYMPFKGITDGTLVDKNKVRERLGIWPEQVIDYKALVGDSSDHYPGVAGIGPKTAIKLLEEFGTFEEVVKRAGNQKIVEGYEGGELSKRLATIRTDVPVTLSMEVCPAPDEDKIMVVLKQLGYKSLARRVGGPEVKIDDSQPKLFDE
jgi:DNA polymerase I